MKISLKISRSSQKYEDVATLNLKDQSSEEKVVAIVLLKFGKFMKNGAFFVFTACSESL
jgi:hypothetical protein